jgi:hypothetical protein
MKSFRQDYFCASETISVGIAKIGNDIKFLFFHYFKLLKLLFSVTSATIKVWSENVIKTKKSHKTILLVK